MAALEKLGTADLDRSFQVEENRLTHENFASFLTKGSDFSFQEVDILSWPRILYFEQSLDDGVDV